MRFMAVSLIVMLHFLTPVANKGGAIEGLFFATWTLRIPLLVFVSGWFSKAEPPTARSIVRLIQSVVVVYFLFDFLQRIQIYLMSGNFVFRPEEPVFGMWFLLTLATWRLVLPYVVRIRWFGAIAVVVSLASGWSFADQTFSLQHSLALFPFFLLGWYARQSSLRNRLGGTPVKVAAAVVLLLSSAAGWLLRETLHRRMVGMYVGYQDGRIDEALWRAGLLLWGAAVVIAVLALMPRSRIPVVSVCGAGSMYAYLLHQFIQRWWLRGGGPEFFEGHGTLGIIALALLALGLAVILMLPGLRKWFRPFVQPRATWFLRQNEPISDVGRRVVPAKPRPAAMAAATGSTVDADDGRRSALDMRRDAELQSPEESHQEGGAGQPAASTRSS